MKIGLVPMAAKPLHAGHWELIQIASRENDVVHLYVSLGDRDNVSGEAMSQAWKQLIEPKLPPNVKVTYGGSPVRNVFVQLGEADKAGSADTFSVYSDPDDIKNFKTLPKYASSLVANGQVKLRAVSRNETVNVSGTQMRSWLASGDFEQFAKHVPQGIDAKKYWDALAPKKGTGRPKAKKGRPTSESLLRQYVSLVLGRR